MTPFKVKILASDHVFYEGECLSISLPIVDGMYGIRANHINMMSAVVPGVMSYVISEGESLLAAVSYGILKVKDGEVLIMVETIEKPEELDAKRISIAEKEAEEMIQKSKRKNTMDIEYNLSVARMQRERGRLNALKKSKLTKGK